MPSPSMTALGGRIRANRIDPSQGPATVMDPAARLDELEQSYRVHPGRAPGGSGTTGLQSMDARGYSDMLNERLQYMRLLDLGDGGAGEVNVRADPRSNVRSSFTPLDYYRAPTSLYANGELGSALGALRERNRSRGY